MAESVLFLNTPAQKEHILSLRALRLSTNCDTVDGTRAGALLRSQSPFNSNVVLQQNQNFGPALAQPQAVLQGRLLRVSSQIKF